MEVQLVHMFSFLLYLCVDCLVVYASICSLCVYVSITVGSLLPCVLYIFFRLKHT